VQVEPSLDADSWEKREERYIKKFEAGKRYIPALFSGISIPSQIEQIAVFVFGSKNRNPEIAGGKVKHASDYYSEIVTEFRGKKFAKGAVPEQFPLMRTIQFCCEYEKQLFT